MANKSGCCRIHKTNDALFYRGGNVALAKVALIFHYWVGL